MLKRTTLSTALLGSALLACIAAATWAGGTAEMRAGPARPDDAPSDMNLRFTVVIPQATYQSIVVSPRACGQPNEPIPFVIRTRDAEGRVSDFPFFARVGDLHTVTFPTGWSPPTEAALFAPVNTYFAAWGVTAGRGASGGQTIRFEPIDRDPQRDERDRDRARAFDEFLREVERNR